jgi:hypothetical protein
MRYRVPDLRDLKTRTAKGDSQNCGNGSVANPGFTACVTGQGDQGETGCAPGTGNGWQCFNGTGALDDDWVPPYWCTEGVAPNTSCTGGSNPVIM